MQEDLDVSAFKYTIYSLKLLLTALLYVNVLVVRRREMASLLILGSSVCVLKSEARENKGKKE